MSDEQPRRWTVYTEEVPATDMLDWPPDLAKKTVSFFLALALEAGAAVDAGRRPPGDPMDDIGLRYSLQVDGEPVLFEYEVVPEVREIRIPVVVWFG
ncbi:hypothetical protein [Streptomyces cacaoi]|uniref:hypothetical protein n=1 Tax=Streptomyces cacaoi TaxID=1898 RepID=UPI00261C9B0E|nr:hypothetical protein [Streptomyces cacaoi]